MAKKEVLVTFRTITPFGNYSEEKFRFYFVDTIVQTAIVPINRNAKDESLHELDFILPKQKLEDFKVENLHWIGIINIDENIKNSFWKFAKI